jgi:hypothetical protein
MGINLVLPEIGTFYHIEGISGHASTTWELQRVTVVLGESDSKDEVRQTWMIVAVDDEANDLGEDPEYINPEMYDYKEM